MASQSEIDKFLNALIGFESGGDATAQNPKASASGLFGYIDSTWAGYGGYTHARDAPAEVQWAKARADVANKLQRYGGDWRLVAMSWYLPAAVSNSSLRDTVPAPEAGNTQTPNQYADLVMSRFTGKTATTATATSTGGGSVATTTAPKSRQQLLDYIAENYPNFYGLLQIDAGVREVLLTAAEKEYTPAKLAAELAQTTWWKKTAATARRWDADYAQDRATGEQLLEQTRRDISARAQRLGIALSAKDLNSLALNVRRLGWTDQMLGESLAARFRIRTAKPGQGTATVESVRSLAADYGVTLSDHTVSVWTQRLLGGRMDEAGLRVALVDKAKKLYPSIADEIDADLSVRDYFDPYAQRAAQILGVNPEEIDFSDRRWSRALNQIGEKGVRVPMTFEAWERDLRTNPLYGYDKTTRGRSEAASFAEQFSRAVGY